MNLKYFIPILVSLKVATTEFSCLRENTISGKSMVEENPLKFMKGKFSNMWVYPRRQVILPRCSYTEFLVNGQGVEAKSEIRSIEGKVVNRIDDLLQATEKHGVFHISGVDNFYGPSERIAKTEIRDGRPVLVDITCEEDIGPSETWSIHYEGTIVVFHADQHVLGYSFCTSESSGKQFYLILAVRSGEESAARLQSESDVQTSITTAKSKLASILREISLEPLANQVLDNHFEVPVDQLLEEMPKSCP